MQNGSGFGLFVRAGGQMLFFDSSATQTIDLAPEAYTATVGGHEPSSASVKIEFIQGNTVTGSQTFSTPQFFGFIPFIVN